MKKIITLWYWVHPCATHGDHVTIYGGDCEYDEVNAKSIWEYCRREYPTTTQARRASFLMDDETGDVDELPF